MHLCYSDKGRQHSSMRRGEGNRSAFTTTSSIAGIALIGGTATVFSASELFVVCTAGHHVGRQENRKEALDDDWQKYMRARHLLNQTDFELLKKCVHIKRQPLTHSLPCPLDWKHRCHSKHCVVQT